MFDREEEMDRYLDEIKDMLRRKQYAAVRDLLLPLEPPDIAMLLEEAGEEFMPLLYRLLPKELAAETFVEMGTDAQAWSWSPTARKCSSTVSPTRS